MGENTAYMRHKYYAEDLAKIDRIYYSLSRIQQLTSGNAK